LLWKEIRKIEFNKLKKIHIFTFIVGLLLGSVPTKTHSSHQSGGGERAGRGPVHVPRVVHQEGGPLLQTARHADVVDAQEPTAGERDVPRRV